MLQWSEVEPNPFSTRSGGGGGVFFCRAWQCAGVPRRRDAIAVPPRITAAADRGRRRRRMTMQRIMGRRKRVRKKWSVRAAAVLLCCVGRRTRSLRRPPRGLFLLGFGSPARGCWSRPREEGQRYCVVYVHHRYKFVFGNCGAVGRSVGRHLFRSLPNGCSVLARCAPAEN